MEERCDQIRNCKDKSDENNCKLIVFEDNYNEKVPPFTITEGDNSIIPAKIRVSTQLKNVLAISEFSHTIDLKIGISLKWYENRVLYHNLKAEEALNVLTDIEVNFKIHILTSWIFLFIFEFYIYIISLKCVSLGQHDLDSLHHLPKY